MGETVLVVCDKVCLLQGEASSRLGCWLAEEFVALCAVFVKTAPVAACDPCVLPFALLMQICLSDATFLHRLYCASTPAGEDCHIVDVQHLQLDASNNTGMANFNLRGFAETEPGPTIPKNNVG